MVFMTVDKRGRGTLPEQVRRDLGLGGGDEDIVLFEKTPHGTYEVVPAALIPTDQRWFHHPAIQARLAEAEADFGEGRSTRADSPEAALAHLNRQKEH
jgi:bifunctional DNA-binding transcriptional regulator/antitoxin component of YhaV-PrlF toxin-antitoxin module